MEITLNALRQQPELASSIRRLLFTDSICEEDVNLIRTLTNLKALECCRWFYTRKDLQVLRHLTTLTELDLSSTQLRPNLIKVVNTLTNITSLWISELPEVETFAPLPLRSLILDTAMLPPDGTWEKLFSSYPSLTRLGISSVGCNLAPCLRSLVNIHTLILGNWTLSHEDLELLSQCSSIRTLKLEGAQCHIPLKPPPNLTKLCLSYCNIPHFLPLLPSLTSLTLHSVHDARTTAYSSLSNLKKLEISYQDDLDLGRLVLPPNLTHLNLSHNGLMGSDLSFLQNNTTLIKLDLRGNSIRGSNLAVLVNHPSLTSLSVEAIEEIIDDTCLRENHLIVQSKDLNPLPFIVANRQRQREALSDWSLRIALIMALYC